MTQLGMIGLGRMGANMVRRLQRGGIRCVVHDRSGEAVAAMVAEGATGAASLDELVRTLDAPRAIWLMIPAAIVDSVIADLAPLLAEGDIIIDGGNSYYIDDIRRDKELSARGIHYVDVGTSGGVWGLERGYCQMIGGEPEPVERLDPVFAALAPALDSAPRTPGREARPGTAERGYLRCGPAGAGHFVKMVHNGIEYGVMAAYAEGFNILKHANVGSSDHDRDAETTPLRDPEHYQYDLDLGRHRRGVAPRQRDRLVAARPHRRSVAGIARPCRLRRPGLRLGRRALDAQGRNRRGRPGAGAECRALPAVLVARRGRLRRQAPLRDARRLRWPSREAVGGTLHPLRVDVEPDGEAAAQRVAAEIVAAAAEAIEDRGQFTLAVSGGRTPARMLQLLSEADIDWDRVALFQVDERVAPAGDLARNLTELQLCLFDHLETLPRLHAMPVEADDLAAAAARYAAELPERLDLIHLGLGADGHTASLVPGDPVLEATTDVAMTASYMGHRRMTLTYPVLDRARRVVWLVTGAAKRDALAQLVAGDASIPAARVARERAIVVCDREASAQP